MYKNYKIEIGKSIKDALKKLRKNGFKCLVVVNSKDIFLGTISDGDLRNAILKDNSINSKIDKYVNKKPVFYFEKNLSLAGAKSKLIKYNLPYIPILSKYKKVVQIIDLKFIDKIKAPEKISLPVVIMAGGKGTRLLPYTKILPKPLIPYKGKPLIEHILNKFKSNGVSEFYISINYKSSLIKAFFSDFKNSSNIKYIKENKPLGTAGSLKFLNKIKHNHLLVVNCDSFLDFNVNNLFSYHKENNCDITIVASLNALKIPYGVIDTNKDGSLIKMSEKPQLRFLANTVCYLIKKKIIQLIPKKRYFNFNELIEKAIKNKLKLKIFSIKQSDWKDLGTLDEIN